MASRFLALSIYLPSLAVANVLDFLSDEQADVYLRISLL
jgi:hypothetical protein